MDGDPACSGKYDYIGKVYARTLHVVLRYKLYVMYYVYTMCLSPVGCCRRTLCNIIQAVYAFYTTGLNVVLL